ncbi:MAG TPA: trehalase family glycosidase [Isosphaeraceae bacterium]|nr:trehalase family glycosidase [Isosphaeraceae bacterium]
MGAVLGTAPPESRVEPRARPGVFNVAEVLAHLIDEEDTDHDKKITVADPLLGERGRGDRRFVLKDGTGAEFEIVGTYPLSNLLQELTLAREEGRDVVRLNAERIYEPPGARISRLIGEIFWDKLTRRVDAEHLDQVLRDEKISNKGSRYLYVPHRDAFALEYFHAAARRRPELNLTVVCLPEVITLEYVRGLVGRHGLLNLALRRTSDGHVIGTPFVVPGGRFNEMYGWDSYFMVLGLLADGRVDLARAMVDNFVYQITFYGKILNANRTYYLTRSQPPFLTSMALAIYEALPRTPASREWLATALRAAVREYCEVWIGPGRRTGTGLSRYHGDGVGTPPEVEPGHFDPIYRQRARECGLEVGEFARRYRTGLLHDPALDRFFVNDCAVRESGHDTTYRWSRRGDGGCADYVTVDLNCLLYKYEIDLARAVTREFGGALPGVAAPDADAATWSRRAATRKELILKYLWNDEDGLFMDYDIAAGERSTYVAATTLYPLWACHPDDPATRLVTQGQAERLVRAALRSDDPGRRGLEQAGGLVACTETSRGPIHEPDRPQRQWDYPNGWAPHQMITWRGLLNYGFERDARRLIYRWLYTLTRNAVDYNGTIPEKLNVVRRSHEVFDEYGNVGTRFAYITREGFGWTNASYQVGLALLPEDLRRRLDRLIPPEWIFRE